MAGDGTVLAPGHVYVVVLPDKSIYLEPYVFFRQDQAEELADAFEGAEWFESKLYMAADGKRAIEYVTGKRCALCTMPTAKCDCKDRT